MYLGFFCTLVLGILPTECAPLTDVIDYMPGLSTQPSFRHYSGYLAASDDKRFHYWFVESEEEHGSRPVVLWLNGGPGCSSLAGLLTEHGPFLVQSDGETLEYNPYSWNKIANILYLESPAGVGFSYSDDKNYVTNDTEVAENNYQALKDFFRLFPEFQENDFYITGESYGGVYVPTLAVRVSRDPSINLKGIAVGNGLLSTEIDANSLLYFSYYHGLIDSQLWSLLQLHCCEDGKCSFTDKKRLVCLILARKAYYTTMGGGMNIYNLYQPCADGAPGQIRDNGDHVTVYHPGFFSPTLGSHFKEKLANVTRSQKPVKMGVPCINNTAIITFLNKVEVRAVLHIPDEVQEWGICSETVFSQYEREVKSVYSQFKELLKKEYRILVYNGDVDMACNFLGNEWFLDSLNITFKANYRPWLYTEEGIKQIAGFVKEFSNLTFVTVKGAGHMVPTDKPNVAFVMFSHYIRNEPF
ncbi:lysosomal protective protein-like [Pelobates fuscus]|uniref:lysosomal protective protein-like n=1 Tax=Pelobates fuscus TaxID=191477 RepID=UPI002FE47ED7